MAPDARRARVTLRQLVLFLLSLVVPSIVLVSLGVRIIVQQEELADKHAADQHRLRANELERALAARLDRIRLDPDDSLVALVATVVDSRLILPWETSSRTIVAADARFNERIARVEREEFAERLKSALAEVEAALNGASSDGQRAYARLLRARIYAKAQRLMESDQDYRVLLTVPLSIADEDGMPFALYAADRLLASGRTTGADRKAIAAMADSAAQPASALPPAAWYLLRRVDDASVPPAESNSRARRDLIAGRIADVEHALTLQRDIRTLISQWKVADGVWLPHGAPLWLVGIASQDTTPGRLVVAVRAESLLATAGITLASNGAGEWLGDRFPGLKVNFSPPDAAAGDGWVQRGFYAALLAIVLSVTLFGGYLLWRDVDREVRVAALRSQFVSSVSHELKTPLTAIRMFAETLQLGRADAQTRAEYLDTIVNETERLTRLLNNVLDFSKI